MTQDELTPEEKREIRKRVCELDPQGFSADREILMIEFGAKAQLAKCKRLDRPELREGK